MRLNAEARAVLGHTPIGMLALRAGRLPLVNPAVFHFASGSLWMTTSRYAAKILSAKRDPRAAFLVDGGSKALLRVPALRSAFVNCPHCGFRNPLDVLASCRRCGTTEFGSRLFCTTCKQLTKAFACDRCTATIKVL